MHYSEEMNPFQWLNTPGRLLLKCQRLPECILLCKWRMFCVNHLLLEQLHWKKNSGRRYYIISHMKRSQSRWRGKKSGCGRRSQRQDADMSITSTHLHIFSHSFQGGNIFSHFTPYWSHKGEVTHIDCCARLIRLIRFFSAEAWNLTRHDSRPLHRAPWWVRMRLYIHQAGSTSHSLSHTHTHPLMDQISTLAHKPSFPPVFFTPLLVLSLCSLPLLVPSVRDNRWVIKIYTETKVALI